MKSVVFIKVAIFVSAIVAVVCLVNAGLNFNNTRGLSAGTDAYMKSEILGYLFSQTSPSLEDRPWTEGELLSRLSYLEAEGYHAFGTVCYGAASFVVVVALAAVALVDRFSALRKEWNPFLNQAKRLTQNDIEDEALTQQQTANPNQVKCFLCGQDFSIESFQQGKIVQCPHCKKNVKAS